MKIRSFLKKFIILFLIILYFGLTFTVAYGWRLKQTDTQKYEAFLTDIKAKYQYAQEKVVDTSQAAWEKTTLLATAAKDTVTDAVTSLKDKAAETFQSAMESTTDVYAQEPEAITSPVNDLVDASYDTDETYSYVDDNSGETMLSGGAYDILYYNQTDARWKDKYYGGKNTIGKYGCGPTTLAMAVSSLTSENITPDEMAVWAKDNGYFCNNSGSYHSLIPEGAAHFGLEVENLGNASSEKIMESLWTGKVIVALMSQGHFTNSGHFLLVRGVTLDGKILIADPLSQENSLKAWDLDILVNELKRSAASGGPIWAISQ